MNQNTICLGPFSYSSPDFPGVTGNVFIDETKTKQVVVFTPSGEEPSIPTLDAILLYEVKRNGGIMRWYECPSIFGRIYTLMANACEVYVTSFENGMLSFGELDGLEYGSNSFCFGKIYDEESYPADNCFSSFLFDGRRFFVNGNESDWFGLFDCSSCWPLDFATFGLAGEHILPDAPEEPESPTENEIISSIVGTGDSSDDEQKIIWLNGPDQISGTDTVCEAEVNVSSPDDCESRENPAIAILPSGHAVIAYESRSDDGSTDIKMSIIDSTAKNYIFYYRNLSKGTLLNDSSISYGSATFDIYDDVYISTTDDIPDSSLYLGFLSGPLAGGFLYKIERAIRVLGSNNKYHWSFSFSTGSKNVEFKDSNNVNDVSFIITKGNLTNPSIGDLFTLPPHLDESGNKVPVANPSIAIANNAHMIDTSQNLYLAYQAFVGGHWNIYVKHIRLTEREEGSPLYVAPYSFSDPTSNFRTLSNTTEPTVIYKVVDKQISGINLCVLFEVYLTDNKQVLSCLQESGIYTHDCGLEAPKGIASVEVVYLPSYGLDSVCYTSWPDIGDEFSGPWETITASIFASDTNCVSNISIYPESTNWCINDTNCNQFYLFDDPYCPSPYGELIDIQYNPADLWTIKVGDEWATRVLYHMSATAEPLTVLERDDPGYVPTFLKKAEVLITYSGDLSDIWTNQKDLLSFIDIPPAYIGRADKGLTNNPYPFYDGRIYNVDKVHISPNYERWIYYSTSGDFDLDYPAIGTPESGRTNPILVSEKSRKPKIKVNNKNGVVVAYESLELNIPQIQIKGTDDLHYGGIIGSKGGRITKFLDESDFQFSHSVSSIGEGVNQLVDFVIDDNDICHMVWQSNRDAYWQIYYANSSNLFEPIRVTKSESRASHPRIDIDKYGIVYVIYQDNRFGPFEVLLSYKDEKRVLPLLQQDAYLASLRQDYNHYTNVLPIVISNNGVDSGNFNVKIDFYDNFNLDGDPVVSVDSREDLEAFIVDDDPYIDFPDANGFYLSGGTSKFITFDASHTRPGSSRLSYPYSFETNIAYFPKIYIIDQNNNFFEVDESQSSSFSCNKCSRLGDNIFDHHSCSYSWTLDSPGTYNFFVDFYGDPNYQNGLFRYRAQFQNNNLQYFEVNDTIASALWSYEGLVVGEGEKPVIQVYPALDSSNGLLCGVTYYVKVTNADTSEEFVDFRGTFFCECSTTIFQNQIQALSEIAKWHSSAHGYSDTRITDRVNGSMLPVIKTRSSGAAIIAFESDSKIKAATFRKANPDEFFGSGTKSWFDYDFGISGQNVALAVDIFDRAVMVYEKPEQYPDSKLPRNSIASKNCAFSEEGLRTTTNDVCDISFFTSNVITKDDFISSELIKKVKLHPDSVEYYTYNVVGDVSPVVSTCNVKLIIVGTPEVVAYRLRNEGDSFFSAWCPSGPEISNYTTEKEWTLTQGSGVKEVCVQAITYNGITTEFCVPIIADYKTIAFEIRLFSDSGYSNLLASFNGMFVASTGIDESGNQTSTQTIYIEIVPSKEIDFIGESRIVNFDVFQQGFNDLFDLVATESFIGGRQVFRGNFDINREDNIVNKDGLARIRARFADECESVTQLSFGTFNKDSLNLTSKDIQEDDEREDAFSGYRQDISGDIGVGMVIRPEEDPYLIFGDPNFFLKHNQPSQGGVRKIDDSA